MAAALASNPPALPDEQQLLSDLQGGSDIEEYDTTTTVDGEAGDLEWLRPSVNRVLESAKLCQPLLAEFCEFSSGPESKHFLVPSALAHQLANYVADKSVMVLSVMPAAQCSELFNGLSQLLRACWQTDLQGSTAEDPRWPVHITFPESVCQQLRDIALWGVNQLSILDDVNGLDADERAQRYLNCGLAGLELCEMMLVSCSLLLLLSSFSPCACGIMVARPGQRAHGARPHCRRGLAEGRAAAAEDTVPATARRRQSAPLPLLVHTAL
jgi:hypothetical protein